MILIPSQFLHMKDISTYNHNYYKNIRFHYLILEESNDDVEFSYYIVTGDANREYIGTTTSEDGLDGINNITLI